MFSFSTYSIAARNLSPGDVYLTGNLGGYETREVLGILQHGSMGSVLLEVRKADGNVVRSTLSGVVNVLGAVA